MDREPSYPDDAPVGAPVGRDQAETPAQAPAGEKADEKTGEKAGENGSNRTRQIVAGAAIGIGSAALVAALLYANRSRKGGKNRK